VGHNFGFCFGTYTERAKLPAVDYYNHWPHRLYSRELDPRTHKRRNLGTFDSRAAAEKHERAVQFFKRRG